MTATPIKRKDKGRQEDTYLTPDHMRDLHEIIIHDVGEVIGRIAI